MTPIQQTLLGTGAIAEKTYVDEVFSTYLFTADNSAQQITNGINLSGEGGLVWSKTRTVGDNHRMTDTVRGANKTINSDGNIAEYTSTGHQGVSQFNTSGFNSGLTDSFYNNDKLDSWSFRRAKGFFDICEWTGNNSSSRNISHNLNCTPAVVMIKRTDSTGNWIVHHYDKAMNTARNFWLNSNLQGDFNPASLYSGGYISAVFDSHFTVSLWPNESLANVNATGGSYIAYVFAGTNESDSKIFGESNNANIIHAGSYVGDGGAGTTEIDLGWQPQWLLVKRYDGAGDWEIIDSMRGFTEDSSTTNNIGDTYLSANKSLGDSTSQSLDPTSTGFKTTAYTNLNINGDRYVYLAIRRPDGYVAKPRSASELFTMDTGNSSSTIPLFDSGFPVDFALFRRSEIAAAGSYTSAWILGTRLTGTKYLRTDAPNAAASLGNSSPVKWDSNVGWAADSNYGSSVQSWMWRRSKGLTTVVYTGNQSNRQISHDMNNVPEMMWIKGLDAQITTQSWVIYHKDLNGGTDPAEKRLTFATSDSDLSSPGESDSAGHFNDTEPTSTHFTVGDSNRTNKNDESFLGVLFSSSSGAGGTPISKCGSYSGSGSSGNAQNIGFQPRLVIIKRTNASEDWFLFDSLRGISNSGADAYQLINRQQQTYEQDYISISSTGFSFSDGSISTNAENSTYIYYAHA